jgi:hypothetical protein
MWAKSRAICCAYQFAYTLIYHLQLDAKDLQGNPKLPSQRGRLSNDVLLLGKAAIKRLLTWSFAASQMVVGAHRVLRAVMMGTMGNEHFNAMVRWGRWGDDSICSIDGSMTRANFRNWLGALLNVLPQVGASRERTKGDTCTCLLSTVPASRRWRTSCTASS